jgi:hypothetical protein
MSLVFGLANPTLQKVLLELCFSDQVVNPEFWQSRIQALDQALKDDVLSGEQLRILPLLYRLTRLTPLDGMSAESMTKMLGMYKHTLCRNNLMLHRLSQVQAELAKAGFAPMIGLKGLPSISYLQEGMGARPMADIDVLVPHLHERPQQVLDILSGMGYRIKGSGFRSLTAISRENLELDLHWYAHDWAVGQDLVDLISQHARPHSFDSHAFLIPCVEHHLAHTMSHGVLTKTLTFDARWVFDTVAVLRRFRVAGFISPDRFAEFVNSVAAPQRVRDALAALANDLPDAVDVDRELLWQLHESVNSNTKFVSWLYNHTPTPNIGEANLPPMPRLDRLKSLMISFFWIPICLRRRQGVSFLTYFAWLSDFPPLTKRQSAWLFVKKVFTRGPRSLYRLLARK